MRRGLWIRIAGALIVGFAAGAWFFQSKPVVPTLARCDNPVAAAYTDDELAVVEYATHQWTIGLADALRTHVSASNPSGVVKEVIWDELGPLTDIGCGPWPSGPIGPDRRSLELMQVTAPCPARMSADGDGKKTVCAWDAAYRTRSKCTVYAIGSDGDFAFENAVLAESDCVVFTFDCTMGEKWNLRRQIAPRHWFMPYCIAAKTDAARNFYTLRDLRTVVVIPPPTLLKIDVEGYEHAVMEGWRLDDDMPEQIAVEVHCTTPPIHGTYRYRSAGELATLQAHMHTLGYRLASMRWEGGGADCTFVRLACPVK